MPKGVYPRSEEHRRNIGLSLLGKNVGKVRTKEHIETYRRVNKTAQLWQDPKYREKQLEVIKTMLTARKVKPNKPEKFIEKLLQQLFPNQWKYVGNFEEWIGGRNPDFINVNGQKKIIEFNGDYWHGEKLTGRTKEEEEQQRIDVFAKEGYQTLIIWERELDDINLLTEKIMDFHSI